MKILDSCLRSSEARYRWMVASRILAAVVGGFLIANLSVPAIAGFFASQQVLATYSAMLFSFVVWLLVIIWVFSASSLKRVWGGTGGILLILAVLTLLFKP